MSTLKTSDVIKVFGLFRELNGVQEIIEDGGKKKVVITPYDFTGAACIEIAENINALRGVIENYNAARELLKPGEEYEKNLTEILERPVEVKLASLKLSTLKLGKNRIQPGIIADLMYHGLVIKDSSQ